MIENCDSVELAIVVSAAAAASSAGDDAVLSEELHHSYAQLKYSVAVVLFASVVPLSENCVVIPALALLHD